MVAFWMGSGKWNGRSTSNIFQHVPKLVANLLINTQKVASPQQARLGSAWSTLANGQEKLLRSCLQ